MIDFILDFMFVISSVVFASMAFILIKNANTYKNYTIIRDAIFAYRIHCILKNQKPLVNYDDEEDYDSTLFRFWDWGYENILPKEKYEIIKPYIK